jgi:hypothetical protein
MLLADLNECPAGEPTLHICDCFTRNLKVIKGITKIVVHSPATWSFGPEMCAQYINWIQCKFFLHDYLHC